MIAWDFGRAMGKKDGRYATESFGAPVQTMLAHARRPSMRHGLECPCFCGDESAFANMIAAAAMQDREDACLFAGTLMTGDGVYQVVSLGEKLSAAFLELARRARSRPRVDPVPAPTRH